MKRRERTNVGREAPSVVPVVAPRECASRRSASVARAPCAAALVLLAALTAGCQPGDAGAGFRLYRPAWDTLVVALAAPGPWQRTSGDSVLVSIVDARGFVVADGRAGGAARGGAWRLALRDDALGSREPLIAEVCVGTGQGARVEGDAGTADWTCEQAPFEASPKRTRAVVAASYPAGGDPDRLVLRVRAAAERPAAPGRPDGAPWRAVAAPERLLARLSVEGRAGASVVVPFAPETAASSASRTAPAAADTMRLAGQAGYDAYWLALQERLFYGESARVRIEVLRAGAGPDAPPLARLSRVVVAASESDRRAEVLRLAALGERALAAARPDIDGASLGSSVSGWRFDRLRRRYQIRLAFSARDTLGRARTWRGDLWVPERGGRARFAEAPTGDSLRLPLDFTFSSFPSR